MIFKKIIKRIFGLLKKPLKKKKIEKKMEEVKKEIKEEPRIEKLPESPLVKLKQETKKSFIGVSRSERRRKWKDSWNKYKQ